MPEAPTVLSDEEVFGQPVGLTDEQVFGKTHLTDEEVFGVKPVKPRLSEAALRREVALLNERSDLREGMVPTESDVGKTSTSISSGLAGGIADVTRTADAVLFGDDLPPVGPRPGTAAFELFEENPGVSMIKPEPLDNPLRTATEFWRKGERETSELAGMIPGNQLVADVAGTAARMAPVIMASGVNPALGVVTSGIQQYGGVRTQAEAQYLKAGLPEAEAAQMAHEDASISAATTLLITTLFQGIAPGLEGWTQISKTPGFRNRVMDVAKNYVGEWTEEGWQQFMDGLQEKARRNPDKPWKEVIDESLHAGNAAGLITVGMKTAAHFGDVVEKWDGKMNVDPPAEPPPVTPDALRSAGLPKTAEALEAKGAVESEEDRAARIESEIETFLAEDEVAEVPALPAEAPKATEVPPVVPVAEPVVDPEPAIQEFPPEPETPVETPKANSDQPGETPDLKPKSKGFPIVESVSDQVASKLDEIKALLAPEPTPVTADVTPPVVKESLTTEASTLDIRSGDVVEWEPHDNERRYQTAVRGTVVDVISNGEGDRGFHILAPQEGDPNRVVRVWEHRGKIVSHEPSKVEVQGGKPVLGLGKTASKGAVSSKDSERRTSLRAKSITELADDIAARGIDPQASYGEFVKARDLKPEINAKEWLPIYRRSLELAKLQKPQPGTGSGASSPAIKTPEPIKGLPSSVGARKATKEGVKLVEEAKAKLRAVINNPDIVGKQRADAIENGKNLIGFLQAKADTRRPMETDVVGGDKVAFTGEDAPDGFRAFIYLEGAKAGASGVSRTVEAKAADSELKKKEWTEQQAAANRIAEASKPAPKAVAKEPWQMTKAEWLESQKREIQSRIDEANQMKDEASRKGVLKALNDQMESATTGKPVFVQTESVEIGRGGQQKKVKRNIQRADVSKFHKLVLEDALREGKPVPKEVLADYPELSKPEPKPVSKSLVQSSEIRGENISVGERVRWMSGGTWKGTVESIEPYTSSVSGKQKHNLSIKADNGETIHLKGVEDYGLSKDQPVKESKPEPLLPNKWPDVKRGETVIVDGNPVKVEATSNDGRVWTRNPKTGMDDVEITGRYTKPEPAKAVAPAKAAEKPAEPSKDKPSIIDRADAALLAAQKKLDSGKLFTGVTGFEPLIAPIVSTAIDIARAVLKATKSVAQAVEAAIQHVKDKADAKDYREAELRSWLEGQLAENEASEDDSIPTGLKNAIGKSERELHNMPEALKTVVRPMIPQWELAGETLKSDPDAGTRIVTRLTADPTTGLSDSEAAVLLRHKVTITNAKAKAANDARKATTPEAKADAEARFESYHQQLQELLDAIKARGEHWGREGRWRRALAFDDFTFESMEADSEMAKGRPLTEDETAELQAAYDRIKDLEEKLAAKLDQSEIQNSLKAAEDELARVQKELDKTSPYIVKVVERITARLDKRADDSRAALKTLLGRTNISADPTILLHLANIAAAHIAHVGLDFTKWAASATAEFGDAVTPHLEKAWVKAKAMIDKNAESEFAGKKAANAAKKVLTKETEADVEAHKQELLDGVKEMAAEDDLTDLSRYVKALFEAQVAKGVRGLDTITEAVRADLDPIIPGITAREIHDYFSDYGKSKAASTDAAKVELSQLRGQAQKVSALQDIVEKQTAPRATGQQRVPQSDVTRRLTKLINEAKKKFGIVTTDPARQLKSTLDSIKTRLRNAISDARFEIANRRRIVKGKSAPPSDAEVVELRKTLDELREDQNAIFGQKEMSDEDRLKVAITAAERAEEKSKVQLKNARNQIWDDPDKKTKRVVTSAELEAIKARTEANREEVKELKDHDAAIQEEKRLKHLASKQEQLDKKIAALQAKLDAGDTSVPGKRVNLPAELEKGRQLLKSLNEQMAELRKGPKKTPDEIALQSRKARLKRGIANYLDKRLRGDFSTRKPRVFVPDEETNKLQAAFDLEKTAYLRGLEKDRWNKFNNLQKGVRYLANIYDAAKIGMTTGEWSQVLRQGKFEVTMLLLNPTKIPQFLNKNMKQMFNAMRNEEVASAIDNQIFNHPLYQEAVNDGLHLSKFGDDVVRKEEDLAARWSETIPVVSNFSRATRVFLNKIRFDAWLEMRNDLSESGTPTPEEGKVIAAFVNESTGRGSFAWLGGDKSAFILGRLMFSARFWASRIQFASGHALWKGGGTKRVRKIIAKGYAKRLIGLSIYYGLIYFGMKGDDDDEKEKTSLTLDPRSSDFGKVKIGNTRIDPLAGLGKNIVLLGRGLTGQNRNAKGRLVPVRGKGTPYKGTWRDFANRYAWGMVHPTPGSVVNVASGENVVGEEADFGTEFQEKVQPMTYEDVYKAFVEHGYPRGVVMDMMLLFGETVNTYGKKK